jgi:superfamily II DNA/RNA helicase
MGMVVIDSFGSQAAEQLPSLEKPAPIQQRAIVPLLRGRDLIMQAQSGTGKTAAFVIAILQKVKSCGLCLPEATTNVFWPT